MKHVTLKQLRVFTAVTRTGSVTGAAQALNVSPPAITLQMKLLQEQVGLALVERSPAGMTPTQAGRLLQDTIRRMEAVLADGAAGLAALAGSETGTVHVGIISTAKYFAPHALAAFARANPAIDLSLAIGNRREIVAGLRDHALDLAVMGSPPDELDVTSEIIGDHPHVIVAQPSHALTGRHAVAPAELASETFLVREPGSGTRTLAERFFADAGLAPRYGMEIGSNESIKQAVIAGLGIAFLSAHTIDIEVDSGRLAVLDIVGLPIVRQWYVVRLAQRRLIPAADKFARFFVTDGNSFLPGRGAATPG